MGPRRDGRDLDELRPVAFTRDFTEFAAGSVLVEFGRTRVLCTASAEERARRRGHDESADGVATRDRLDSTRRASPLTKAPDAHVLDTTGRSVEDVVEEVLSWL